MFKLSNRNNPLQVSSKSNKKSTFISFRKNVDFGADQKPYAIYKVMKKDNKIENRMYIGNPYKIGIANKLDGTELNRFVVLQDKENNLYIVPIKEGRKPYITKTLAYIEFRTMLHYTPKLNDLLHYDTENEIYFDMEEELTEFIAIGEGIEGEKFKGYRLHFKKYLHNIENEKENENIENEEENEINNDDFQDVDITDLI